MIQLRNFLINSFFIVFICSQYYFYISTIAKDKQIRTLVFSVTAIILFICPPILSISLKIYFYH
jgi:hypothetical protein